MTRRLLLPADSNKNLIKQHKEQALFSMENNSDFSNCPQDSHVIAAVYFFSINLIYDRANQGCHGNNTKGDSADQ